MKLHVKVKPNSKQQKIEETIDGSLIISLKSPPVDGKANQELIQLLAEKYQVPQSRIVLKTGIRSKTKLVEIQMN